MLLPPVRPLSKSHTTADTSSRALYEQDMALVSRLEGLYNGAAIIGTCGHLVPEMALPTVTILTVEREAVMVRSDPVPHAHPTDRLVGHAPVIQALRAQIRHL